MDITNAPVDFVIIWVDGNDKEWAKKKNRYLQKKGEGTGENRYRDWGTLKYWFRSVEKFAPWVNHIFLVTDNQKPEWIDTSHEKLTIVDHKDIISEEFLPIFNSNAIELNLHRIEGLSERFVYFNDDQFIIRPTNKDMFFKNGLPCDDAILSPIIMDGDTLAGLTCANNMHVINTHFDKKTVFHENFRKMLNMRYGVQIMRTICLLPWKHIPGFYNDHLAQPYLKSTFNEVWELENSSLQEVTSHRFRDYGGDINQWVMRYWQFCKGTFIPVSPKRGKSFTDVCDDAIMYIRKQKGYLICINDNKVADFQSEKQRLTDAFESILPDKSSFEI